MVVVPVEEVDREVLVETTLVWVVVAVALPVMLILVLAILLLAYHLVILAEVEADQTVEVVEGLLLVLVADQVRPVEVDHPRVVLAGQDLVGVVRGHQVVGAVVPEVVQDLRLVEEVALVVVLGPVLAVGQVLVVGVLIPAVLEAVLTRVEADQVVAEVLILVARAEVVRMMEVVLVMMDRGRFLLGMLWGVVSD